MQLPIGMLIYWVNKFEENHGVISGIWYYKELYVPSTVEEKKKSISDLKEKRCSIINIHGKFNQIINILSQGDLFMDAGENEISQLNNLINNIENSSKNQAYLFDEIFNAKGTALMVDTVIDVDETKENIQENLRKGKVVDVNISKKWSFPGDLLKTFEGL